MPIARVLPVPVWDRPMTLRHANTGTKASAWTGVKLVISLPDSTLMTFWEHLFLFQYGLSSEEEEEEKGVEVPSKIYPG